MKYFNEIQNRYCTGMSSEPPEYLKKIEKETKLFVLASQMLTPPIAGRFLSMMSHLISPKKILEIGTFTAYSTLCLAEGLDLNGKIDTIERNDELENRIIKNIKQSPFELKINLHIGEADKLFPKFDTNSYDLIFIDAKKEEYPNYLRKTTPLLKKGGWILADNTMWNGKVYQEEFENMDAATKGIHLFNQALKENSDYQVILLPFSDGLTIARKI